MAEKPPLGTQQDLDVRPQLIATVSSLMQSDRPALLNSLAGLLATLSSIYVANDGKMTSSSQITLILIAASATFFALMMMIYLLWLVRGVRKKHERQMGSKV